MRSSRQLEYRAAAPVVAGSKRRPIEIDADRGAA
jgi:hypothetical protein